jgi:hypothetical protein
MTSAVIDTLAGLVRNLGVSGSRNRRFWQGQVAIAPAGCDE